MNCDTFCRKKSLYLLLVCKFLCILSMAASVKRVIEALGGNDDTFECGILFCRVNGDMVNVLKSHAIGVDSIYEEGLVIKKVGDMSYLVNSWTVENGAMKPNSYWFVDSQRVRGKLNCFLGGIIPSSKEYMEEYLEIVLERGVKWDLVCALSEIPSQVEIFDNIVPDQRARPWKLEKRGDTFTISYE